jgi:hypothetical protein
MRCEQRSFEQENGQERVQTYQERFLSKEGGRELVSRSSQR